MPVDLSELAAPARVRGADHGDPTRRGRRPQLVPAAGRGGRAGPGWSPTPPGCCRAARSHRVPVVHCTAEFRADRAGSTVNCQLVAAVLRNPDHLLAGTPATEIIAELGPEPADLVSSRLHGVSPFTGTSLDTWLRNLGVRTVVATGVSVNLGVLGLAIEAVNLGYQVVVPRTRWPGSPRTMPTRCSTTRSR